MSQIEVQEAPEGSDAANWAEKFNQEGEEAALQALEGLMTEEFYDTSVAHIFPDGSVVVAYDGTIGDFSESQIMTYASLSAAQEHFPDPTEE